MATFDGERDSGMIGERIAKQLAEHGISDLSEVGLREALEKQVETYTLIRLADWPARCWKCRYRLMMGEGMYDAQSAAEAYALGLLRVMTKIGDTSTSE
jgi:hypothetical protein